MRISDWSSDVCSSDLAALIGGLLRYPEALRRNEEALTRLPIGDSGDAELLGVMLDSAMCQEGLDCEGLLAILEPMKVYNRATTLQIGRASCRERVCQYV